MNWLNGVRKWDLYVPSAPPVPLGLLALLILPVLFCQTACNRAPAAPSPEKAPSLEAAPESPGVEPFMTPQARAAFRRSCASCHGHDGHGILAVAPDLRLAKKRSAEEWEKYLRNASGAHPAAAPPPLWIDGDELTAIAAYLDRLTQARP